MTHVWNSNFRLFSFQTPKSKQKCPDFRHFTVWISDTVWPKKIRMSEIWTLLCLVFRHKNPNKKSRFQTFYSSDFRYILTTKNLDACNLKLSEIQTFVCSIFRHTMCQESKQKCPDVRHIPYPKGLWKLNFLETLQLLSVWNTY